MLPLQLHRWLVTCCWPGVQCCSVKLLYKAPLRAGDTFYVTGELVAYAAGLGCNGVV
jgi:hypothetical protein